MNSITTDARNGPGTVAQPSPSPEGSKGENLTLIKKALSTERLESHRQNPSEPDEILFARYQWNVEISETFYAPLQILEVVLRNSFNGAIATKTKNQNWLTEVPAWLQPYGKDGVAEAHDFLRARSRPITQARMVQEMSFGFWTSLLNSKYETLFHAIGAAVFPGMPRARRTRAEASARFEEIRSLRNRVFHFRRIWNRPDLGLDHAHILEAIDWINPNAQRLLLPAKARISFQEGMSRRPA